MFPKPAPQLNFQPLPLKQTWNAVQSDGSGTIDGAEPILTFSHTLSPSDNVIHSPRKYKMPETIAEDSMFCSVFTFCHKNYTVVVWYLVLARNDVKHCFSVFLKVKCKHSFMNNSFYNLHARTVK